MGGGYSEIAGNAGDRQRETILNRWAKRDAAKAIAADGIALSLREIYKIIERARDAGDPRALFRKGRLSAGRVVERQRREGRRLRQSATRPAYEALGFSVRTIFVTRLGAGSVECVRVPISVSTNGGF